MKKIILALMLIGTVGYTAARITNADIASNAAISFSKLQALTSGQILAGNASNVAVGVSPGGEVSMDSSGSFGLSNAAVIAKVLTGFSSSAGAVSSSDSILSAFNKIVGNLALKQDTDAELTALAGLTSGADSAPYFTGSGTAATMDVTAYARTLLDDANQAAARSTLGLTPGTDVQAYDAELAAFAGLSSAADRIGYFNGSGTMATNDFTSAGRSMVGAASAAAQTALLSAFTGDSGSGGVKGLVPAPAAGDAAAGKFLKSDGTWAAPSASSGGGQYIGSLTYSGTTSCNWTQASAGSFANFSADTDCPAASVTGSVSAPGTKIPGVEITVGAGYATEAYQFVARAGRFYLASGASDTCAMRFSDGTNSSAMQTVAISGTTSTTINGVIVFGSSGTKTVQIQGRVSAGADNCNIDASASARDFVIDVFKFSY